MELGGVISAYDRALFIWHGEDNTLKGIIASHVDDFVMCGDEYFESEVIDKLKMNFKVGAHSVGAFKYLGLTVNI